MTPQTKVGIAGVVVGLVLLWLAPWWLALGVIVVALGIPIVGYSMLDSSQKRRIRNNRRRQIGH